MTQLEAINHLRQLDVEIDAARREILEGRIAPDALELANQRLILLTKEREEAKAAADVAAAPSSVQAARKAFEAASAEAAERAKKLSPEDARKKATEIRNRPHFMEPDRVELGKGPVWKPGEHEALTAELYALDERAAETVESTPQDG